MSALRWLWLEQKCLVVLEQRTPFYGMGLPDALGVTPGRYLTEIEIKRSLQDFKADFKKPHRVNRQFYIKHQPRQLYYLVPPDLVEKVTPLLPEWAGLMTLEENLFSVKVLKVSPVNKESPKLTTKQCARLARMMTSHMMSNFSSLETYKSMFKNNSSDTFVDWIGAEVGTYSI